MRRLSEEVVFLDTNVVMYAVGYRASLSFALPASDVGYCEQYTHGGHRHRDCAGNPASLWRAPADSVREGLWASPLQTLWRDWCLSLFRQFLGTLFVGGR